MWMQVLALIALTEGRVVSCSLPEPRDLCPSNICKPEETCCKTTNAYYACCPFPKAVCCLDGSACCPPGYICSNTTPDSCVHESGASAPSKRFRNEHAYGARTTKQLRSIHALYRKRSRKRKWIGMSTQLANTPHYVKQEHTRKTTTVPLIKTASETRTDDYELNYWKQIKNVYEITARTFKGAMAIWGELKEDQAKIQMSSEGEFPHANNAHRNAEDVNLCGNSICVDHHPCCNWTVNMCCYHFEGVCCQGMANICCPMGYECDPSVLGTCRVPYMTSP